MRPIRPSSGKHDLFRERLDAMINMKHRLVKLAGVIDWPGFDQAFGGFYRPVGRPAKPTRLMVGLHYLKHVHDLSDEETVARLVENPYWRVPWAGVCVCASTTVLKMGVGLPKPTCRGRLQTTPCCCVLEAWW